MTTEQLPKEFASAREAEWVRRMSEDFAKTGSYRPEDLRRLLGDPTRGVELTTNASKMKNALLA